MDIVGISILGTVALVTVLGNILMGISMIKGLLDRRVETKKKKEKKPKGKKRK